jgi:hypothetical protein
MQTVREARVWGFVRDGHRLYMTDGHVGVTQQVEALIDKRFVKIICNPRDDSIRLVIEGDSEWESTSYA